MVNGGPNLENAYGLAEKFMDDQRVLRQDAAKSVLAGLATSAAVTAFHNQRAGLPLLSGLVGDVRQQQPVQPQIVYVPRAREGSGVQALQSARVAEQGERAMPGMPVRACGGSAAGRPAGPAAPGAVPSAADCRAAEAEGGAHRLSEHRHRHRPAGSVLPLPLARRRSPALDEQVHQRLQAVEPQLGLGPAFAGSRPGRRKLTVCSLAPSADRADSWRRLNKPIGQWPPAVASPRRLLPTSVGL